MTPPAYTGPGAERTSADPEDPTPLRPGGPCPNCDGTIEELDFVALPGVAIKKEMYDLCVIDTDTLPTPWQHPTVIAYHEDPDPFEDAPAPQQPSLD